jgi:hypothetical protein
LDKSISEAHFHNNNFTTMTDQELKDLVASLAVDTQAMKIEADKRAAEADKRAVEADKRAVEADRRAAETDKLLRELSAKAAQDTIRTKRQLRELGKQIGGVSNKFGKFTEGLALPSVERLLFKRFGTDDFSTNRRKRLHNGESLELDALGVANGSRNEAYIVEIKSLLRKEGVEQLLNTMEKFRTFFPDYADKKAYGIIAAASASKDALEAARQAGLYVISFEDDIMRFHDDDGFVPKAY